MGPRGNVVASRLAREADVILALGTRLVAKHANLIEPLVTHTFPLDQVSDAFALADDKSNRSIKVHVRSKS